ncbi:hypothetical protein AGMMS50239_18600 [Bacteroidia bacterium]|nr:hypothetical protein AGMMS50239_18600 [Bacteroidia bacterium]
MRVLYFDCFSGISGDMALSALLDLGIEKDFLIKELKKLPLEGWQIELSTVHRNGFNAKQLEVILEKSTHYHHYGHTHGHESEQEHAHRSMEDIERIINISGISNNAKLLAKKIFMRLAIAEAKVHNTTPREVHFHEVGAIDSILDIVGTAICIDRLSPDKIYASDLQDGHGFTECRHGKIPVPVPAVKEIFAEKNIPLKQIDIEGEMITPTGAAIIAELAESFGSMPKMEIIKTGYGAGKKIFPLPNVLKVVQGELGVFYSTKTRPPEVCETNSGA